MNDNPPPRPSTHLWCVVCQKRTPYKTRAIHPASRRNSVEFEGNEIVCCGCNSVAVTVYARPEVAHA